MHLIKKDLQYPYNLIIIIGGTEMYRKAKNARIVAQSLDEILSRLETYEQKLVNERYRDNKSLDEVAHEFGITKARARRVEAYALRKLRNYAGFPSV